MERYDSWVDNAFWLDGENISFVNWEEEFYLCPECGEPIYRHDWTKAELRNFVCPICEWEGD